MSSAAWDRLYYHQRRDYLDGLDDAQILVQARIRAKAAGKSIDQILTAWVLNGYLAQDRKTVMLASIAGLRSLTPLEFYQLERAKQRLALALLDLDERWVFAVACALYLSEAYTINPPIPVAEVRRAWRRAGVEV